MTNRRTNEDKTTQNQLEEASPTGATEQSQNDVEPTHKEIKKRQITKYHILQYKTIYNLKDITFKN